VLKKLDQMINQESDFYGHLSRVATYATLFAIALKVEFPVDLGLAGLLHDIGLTALPAQAVDVPYEKLSKELKAAYDQHPQLSIDIIRLKRMVVKERVQKAILQHHERLDGTGTPHQLSGRKVLPEAQILAIATAFDDLTTLTPGRPPLTPVAAFEHLLQLHGGDPTRMGIDVNLIRKLREIYCAKEGDV
jgi:HD-GYP domain-containing protein (c-di-GMP phosphodiesterase class II)